jgi:small subunit ribosomal protein S6
MNTYETIMILDDRMTEERYNAAAEAYTKKLITLGCRVKARDRIGKKKLAYPITVDKEYSAKEGWYILFKYKADSEIIHEIERLLRIDDCVLKFITTRVEESDDYDYEPVPDPEDSVAAPDAKSEQDHPEVQDAFDLIFDI